MTAGQSEIRVALFFLRRKFILGFYKRNFLIGAGSKRLTAFVIIAASASGSELAKAALILNEFEVKGQDDDDD